MDSKYLSQSQIVELNFPKSLIKKYLPQPDDKCRNKHNKRRPIKLFLKERVLAIMVTDEYKADISRIEIKQKAARLGAKKAIQTKEKKLLTIANTLEIRVYPSINIDELKERALADYWYYNLMRYGTDCRKLKYTINPDEDFEIRITANYVKFNHTNYNHLMNIVSNKVGSAQAKRTIEIRLWEEIGNMYPNLGEHCNDKIDDLIYEDSLSYKNENVIEQGLIVERLDVADLESEHLRKDRNEQILLRKILLGDRTVNQCCICHKTFPNRFITVAHIKRRCECTDEEKCDTNIAMLNCPICDKFYENGEIGVQEGVIVIFRKSETTEDLYNLVQSLEGRVCLAYNERTKEYFDYHFAFHSTLLDN